MKETGEEGTTLFEEVQQFTRPSVSRFFKALTGIVFLALLVSLIIQKGRFTDYNKLLIVLLPILLVLNIIFASRLVTQIRTDGLYVRFPPWQSRFSVYDWIDIVEIQVRKYQPMREFMGWGIRYGIRKMGYIVAASACIEIVLKNGYTIIVTTQRGEEVNEVLKRIEI